MKTRDWLAGERACEPFAAVGPGARGASPSPVLRDGQHPSHV